MRLDTYHSTSSFINSKDQLVDAFTNVLDLLE
jgi:hypothetical protein